jgi:hypothetical protein
MNSDTEIILRLFYLMEETITAGYTLTLPFHLSRNQQSVIVPYLLLGLPPPTLRQPSEYGASYQE